VKYRELCKNGWTDRDVIGGVDLSGPKEPYHHNSFSPNPRARKVNFESEKEPAEDVWWSICLKRLGMGQNQYGADADWGVLDGGARWCNLANMIEPSMWGGDAPDVKLPLVIIF